MGVWKEKVNYLVLSLKFDLHSVDHYLLRVLM